MSQTPLNFSIFYYGHTVDDSNFMLDFNEGGGELTAEIDIGSYSLTDFVQAVEDALNNEGTLVYTCSVNRATRLVTVAATGTFSLLVSSGTHAGDSVWSLLGFTGSNKTGSATYTGTLPSGDFYAPQFKLQDFIGSENSQKASDATINKSASGNIEVVRFGVDKFVQLDIKYATNRSVGNNEFFKTNLTGVEDLIRFMQYLITKAPIEAMYDINDRSTFETLILETTPFDNKGIGYELKELYDKGLLGFFETGKLRFRLMEE